MSTRCVVCNKKSTDLILRRSGLKCKGCVGKPATPTNQQKCQQENGFLAIFNGNYSDDTSKPADRYQPLIETQNENYGTNS